MEDLNVFYTVNSLQNWLESRRHTHSVSFVPTMGALHNGHLELVKNALKRSELVVVSIFVNPTQFNNQEDLSNYPRTIEKDLRLLSSLGNVIAFLPAVDEVYPSDYNELDLDLGYLEEVMEGKFRPGHFKGVLNVVKRLFDIVQPDFAFFGLKDFQQLTIIKYMVKKLNLEVEIIECETLREESGLAMSSRNLKLSSVEKRNAEIIHDTLNFAVGCTKNKQPREVLVEAVQFFSEGDLELEYVEIIHPQSLESLQEWVPGARMCIAAYCGKIRLIDNIELIENRAVN